MTITHTFALAATAVVFAAGIAACGDDSGSDDSESTDDNTGATAALRTVPQDEFVERGNELCRANGEAIGSTFRSMSEPPTPAELEDAYDTMLRESYKIIGDMLAIGAPEGQEGDLVEVLVELQDATTGVEEAGQAEFFADQSGDPWKPAADKLVRDFGLTDCGHSG